MMKCRISKIKLSRLWRCGICLEKLSRNVQYKTTGTTNTNAPSLKRKDVVSCLACNAELPLKYNIAFLLKELTLRHAPIRVFSLLENWHCRLLVCASLWSRIDGDSLNCRFNYGLQDCRHECTSCSNVSNVSNVLLRPALAILHCRLPCHCNWLRLLPFCMRKCLYLIVFFS